MVRVEEKERDDSKYRWHLFVKIFIKTCAVFKRKKKKEDSGAGGCGEGGVGETDQQKDTSQ